MSLSDSLVYAPKPAAVSGHKYRQNLPSYNKSVFSPGEVIMLNIPCGRRGQYLNPRMSYLKFTLVNTSATAAEALTPDYSCASLFSRLELYHGSNLLEQIHEYGMLHTLWMDVTGSHEAHKNTLNLMEGTHPTTERTGASVAGANGTRVFAMPLMSGIVGTLQPKMLPTGDMVAGDLRLELTLANNNDGVSAVAARTWQVKDVELMLEYTELSSDAARMISSQNSGGYMISFDSFANLSSTVEQGANNCNILIPARYSSLKTLFTIFRLQTNIGAITPKTVSARSNPFGNTGQWYYSIGGKNVPATPVKSATEAAAELYKAVHAFGTVDQPSLLTVANWLEANAGTSVAAADLETLPHKSKLTESGINTLSTNTHFIGLFSGPTGSPLNVQSFAHFDGVLIIQGGLASVQF